MIEFLPVPFTPAQFIEAARRYKGLAYLPLTKVAETETGPKGSTDCVGLFFLALRDLGALPPDFDPNLPPAQTGCASREAACIAILTQNLVRIPRLCLETGDFVIIKPDGTEAEKHIALYTSYKPGFGSILHAMNDASGRGSVYEQPLDAHGWSQIRHVYRLKNYDLDGAYMDGTIQEGDQPSGITGHDLRRNTHTANRYVSAEERHDSEVTHG